MLCDWKKEISVCVLTAPILCDVWNWFLFCRQAKDVVKGIKKRIGSRNPKAQLLALTVSS